jgi:thioredoxin-related protein
MKPILLLLTITSTLLFAVSSKQDDKTGLVWQDDQAVSQNEMMQEEAITYCQKLKLDGFEDWRLPTLKEAYTIVDLRQERPSLKKGFEIRSDERFWTSTSFAKNPGKEAWRISMSYGEAEPYKKNRSYNVRCVRGQLLQ